MKGRAPHLRPMSLYPHFHFHLAGLCPEKLANKGRREEGEPLEGKKLHCVVPKIIHTSPMGPLSTTPPSGISSAFCGESMDIFGNYTL